MFDHFSTYVVISHRIDWGVTVWDYFLYICFFSSSDLIDRGISSNWSFLYNCFFSSELIEVREPNWSFPILLSFSNVLRVGSVGRSSSDSMACSPVISNRKQNSLHSYQQVMSFCHANYINEIGQTYSGN